MAKKILKSIIRKREKRKEKREFKERLAEWKKSIIRMDDFTCQICKNNIEGRSLHVHHILPNKPKYKKFIMNKMNGILLCPYCHTLGPNAVHKNSLFFSFWLRKNRPQQYNYLINEMQKIQ